MPITIPTPPQTQLRARGRPDPAALKALEQKVLWLATFMIHNANHLRPSRDGLKVGGHQSSSASVVSQPDDGSLFS